MIKFSDEDIKADWSQC